MENNEMYFSTLSVATGWATNLVNLVQNTKLSDEDKAEILMNVVELINESQPV
jgi:hypothetical protein